MDGIIIYPSDIIKPSPSDAIYNSFKCQHCHYLRLPLFQKNRCGCRICGHCLDEFKLQNPSCPGDTDDCQESFLNNLFPDVGAKKEINKFEINCPFRKNGCPFIGSVRIMSDHLQSDCKYRQLICHNCGQNIPPNEKELHDKICEYRPILCEYCKIKLPYKHIFIDKTHYDFINNKLACCVNYNKYQCPYHCDATLTFTKTSLEKHLLWQCPSTKHPCPWIEYGCQFEGLSDEIDLHLMNCVIDHYNKFRDKCLTEAENVNKTEEEMKKLEESVNDIKQKENTLKWFNNIIGTLENRLTSSLLPPSSSSSSAAYYYRLHLNDLTMPMEFPKQSANHVNRSGCSTWKISSIQSHLSAQLQSTPIESEAFYSDKIGYRLRIRCYPKGNGQALFGSFCSLYFSIGRGDFDDLLPWPMQKKVTLEILNPNNLDNSKKQTYMKGPDNTPFNKPREPEFNTAVGNPKFISLTELQGFIKNDCIYVRCKVHNDST